MGEVVTLQPVNGGRLMPSEVEVEQGLLGAVLIDNGAYFRVCRDLRAEHFFEPVHQRIFTAIAKVIDGHAIASPLSLKQFFEADAALGSIGGSQYLFDLAASVVSILNAEHYAATIIDLWQRREQITLLHGAAEDLERAEMDRTAADIGASVSRQISEILTAGRSRGKTRKDVIEALIEDLKAPVRADPTGLACLDKAMAGGLHRGRAYGLVGRKKAGKSCLGGTISFNLNQAGVPHLVVLLEMGSIGYEQRSIGRALGFNSLKFLNARERSDPRFLSDVAQYAHTAPDNVHYLDRPGMGFEEMQQQIVHYVHRHRISGVVLDYMQLLRGRKERQNTAEFLDEVAQWLAEATKKLDIWVLCMAQMNQDDNVRGGEGMRLAFDQVYALHTGAARNTAYLEMWDSRYTPMNDVGTSDEPAFRLSMMGPHFAEIGGPVGMFNDQTGEVTSA